MKNSSIRTISLAIAFMAAAPVTANAACGKDAPETVKEHNDKVDAQIKALNETELGQALMADKIGEFNFMATSKCSGGMANAHFYFAKQDIPPKSLTKIHCKYAPMADNTPIALEAKKLFTYQIAIEMAARKDLYNERAEGFIKKFSIKCP